MLSLEVKHLRLVRAIAETGSVTRAATRLHLTQSALSHQLHDLETRLGTSLFVRGRRGMSPTGAGDRLLAAGETVLAELASAEADLRLGDSTAASPRIRIATECFTCYHWLPRVLSSVRTRWPGAQLRVVPDATRRPLAALLEGRLDVAVVERRLKTKRIAYESLFEDQLVAIVPTSHPFAARSSILPEELAGETLILYRTESESTVVRKILRPFGVEPKELMQLQLTEGILELVRAGMGVSVLARWAVTGQLQSGSFVTVPLSTPAAQLRWSVAYRQRQKLSPILADLIAELHRVGPGQTASATSLLTIAS